MSAAPAPNWKPGLGPKIRAARQARKLSQSALGALCGASEHLIAHYESGRRLPALARFRALCCALQCSADELLSIKPNQT